ncbi:MAG: thioredoxin domain-containing protein [Actinomycetota bacterium]|nr:thioredoxin domain-containing protein [Actinomycetota bacterium]
MNRLTHASSPYLRQHAGNPVDWYPWGPEAFARAKDEDRPLFVSIGYAACHWCHVMAHETFEDPGVADLLASTCIAVKVDREERPDVDALYMAAVQAMTGSGGWPMSVFCTPDGRPFFAGTYFPPSDRHGMPSFRRVVEAVVDAWTRRRSEIEAQASTLAEALQHQARAVDRLALVAPDGGTDWETLSAHALAELARRFDPVWGGFGPPPKFPRPALVELCLRPDVAGRDHGPTSPRSRAMATTTLDAMAAGGIYDHLEGGFARYSTDARWLVPHFEKMLPDQALLARCYLHAWQVTGSATYLQVVRETVDFVMASLSTPDGGFASSLDADAAGVEGGHATWTPAEVRAALGTAAGEREGAGAPDLTRLAATVCEWWGVTEDGDIDGRSVLHRPLGAGLARTPELEAARIALLAARRRRPEPARDDKVLTEWHAMFTAALAEAAWACDEVRWADRAVQAAEHLFTHNRRADGRWLRSAASGVPAFAGDYAAVVTCTTWLTTLTGDARWAERGEEVAGAMLDLFWDADHGGLFTTGRDAETLVARAKDVFDGALPSANAAAAIALLRLGALTGTDRWTEAGTRIAELALPLVARQPLAVADMLAALAFVDHGAQIVVAGDRPDLLGAVRRRWLPDAVVAWGTPAGGPLWEGRAAGAAYVCRRFVCERPSSDLDTLDEQLDRLLGASRR